MSQFSARKDASWLPSKLRSSVQLTARSVASALGLLKAASSEPLCLQICATAFPHLKLDEKAKTAARLRRMLWTIHGLKMLEQTGLRDHKYVCVRSDNQPCAGSSKAIVLVYFGFATLKERCLCTVEEFLPGWSIGNFWWAQTAISKRKEKETLEETSRKLKYHEIPLIKRSPFRLVQHRAAPKKPTIFVVAWCPKRN